MAALATIPMAELNEDRKQVYPLFQKTSKAPETESDKVKAKTSPQISDLQSRADTDKASAPRGGKPKKAAPIKNGCSGLLGPQHGQADLLEVDPNDSRRKRRKTPSAVNEASLREAKEKDFPKIKELQQGKRESVLKAHTIAAETKKFMAPEILWGLDANAKQNSDDGSITRSPDSSARPLTQNQQAIPTIVDLGRDELPGHAHSPATNLSNLEQTPTSQPSNPISAMIDPTENKPQKILRWNPKTGTIGSPPQKKASPTEIKGRISTLGAAKQRRSKIVTIHYGHSHRLPVTIGPKINRILTNAKPLLPVAENQASVPAETPPRSLKPADQPPAKEPKAIHPLFMTKAVSSASTPKSTTPVQFRHPVAEGPQGSKTVERSRLQPQDEGRRSPHRPSELKFSGFAKSTGILRFPGALEPAWPWKGMIHICGDNGRSTPTLPISDMLQLQSRPKKAKYQAVEVLEQEDVINVLTKNLNIDDVVDDIKKLDPDEFPLPPTCLRIPTKHYEHGNSLQKRVQKELSASISASKLAQDSSSEDEIRDLSATQIHTHPALTNIYGSIATSMSAFDQGQCETQSWTRRYSPKKASEVLQSGRQALILKDWLQTLTVKSVQTGAEDKARSRSSSISRAGNPSSKGKRKRAPKKLDSFVVSSDEEDDDFDELTDPEDDVSGFTSPSLLKKTVIRASDTAIRGHKEPLRLSNTVVMSGPHGCGKSASVYAVARELGFEVFEINSGSRRSGKDILEKVGDMTRNHLVQQSHGEASGDDEYEQADEALARDLKTGRQGTMNSFLKPKEPSSSKEKLTKRTRLDGKAVGKQDRVAQKAPTKQQKQSLILIEEADVIFEEDKQFWATILSLVSQSKRPLIITCNDESAIPLPSSVLHAIVRFNPPAMDLAVDYMLLVAACEGHIIQRKAVKALYESRNLDLRASLTELNFWCQFAVGDCKSGLDWFLPRSFKNSKVDKDKEAIRVVSEGTYEAGMGWLCRDNLESHTPYLDVEEEILHEAWDGWHLDVGDWQNTIHMQSWATKSPKDTKDMQANLEIYEEFVSSISAADLCSGSTFASDHQIPIDASLPKLSAKSREDYVLGRELLEASPLVNFGTVAKDISLLIKSRARNYLQIDQHTSHSLEIPTELNFPREADLIQLTKKQICNPESRICRSDFSLAFDPISGPEKPSLSTTGSLEASSFDRTITIIATDLAPYVRSIVSYDARLQRDRARLSNLMSEGGRKGKRMRTTRAALSALEGGARDTTRKNRYFGSKLNPNFVLKTGMEAWLDAALSEERSGELDAKPAKRSGQCLGGEESNSECDELHQDSMCTDEISNNRI